MGRLGKYARHAAAWIVAAVVAWIGIEITAEVQADLVADVTVALVALMGVIYAWAEKWMKRWRWLDPEGYAERADTKAVAGTSGGPGAVDGIDRDGRRQR